MELMSGLLEAEPGDNLESSRRGTGLLLLSMKSQGTRGGDGMSVLSIIISLLASLQLVLDNCSRAWNGELPWLHAKLSCKGDADADDNDDDDDDACGNSAPIEDG
jgi:hypothetical protein